MEDKELQAKQHPVELQQQVPDVNEKADFSTGAVIGTLGIATAIVLPLTMLQETAIGQTPALTGSQMAPAEVVGNGDAGDFTDCLDCTSEDVQNADLIDPVPTDQFDTEASCGSCAGRGSCGSCSGDGDGGSCGGCGGCGDGYGC